jgi:hypothetical protein
VFDGSELVFGASVPATAELVKGAK